MLAHSMHLLVSRMRIDDFYIESVLVIAVFALNTAGECSATPVLRAKSRVLRTCCEYVTRVVSITTPAALDP